MRQEMASNLEATLETFAHRARAFCNLQGAEQGNFENENLADHVQYRGSSEKTEKRSSTAVRGLHTLHTSKANSNFNSRSGND